MKIINPSILEFLFKNELPGPGNAHQTPHAPGPKGPSDFPYNNEVGDVMDEDEIDAELNEFKLGPTMTDPLNLPGYNVHDGSFSWGKSSKPYSNFMTKSKLSDPSGTEVMVRGVPEQGLSEPGDFDPIEEAVEEPVPRLPKVYKDNPLPKTSIWNHAKAEREGPINITSKLTLSDILTSMHDPEKEEVVRKNLAVVEEVGAREKALAHGDSMGSTTKQPFANGMPKATDTDFMDDFQIMKELGLNESILEWINSSSVFNNHAKAEDAELNFFDEDTNNFVMNSEEDFNENQRKRNKIKNVKKK